MDSLSRVAHEARDKQMAKDSAKRNAQLTIARQRKNDSLIVVIQSALNITKERSTAVMNIINESIKGMDEIAGNRDIIPEEKIKRFKLIAKDRDEKIAAQLTQEQVKTLQEIMKRSRQQPAAVSATPSPGAARQ
jgi:hypothetical protein